MARTNEKIHLDFLDHVALRVKDVDASVKWYQKVYGLKKYRLKEWGDFPVFLLAGKTGLALFPSKSIGSKDQAYSKQIRIDHFAFNVNRENFNKARKIYTEMNIDFEFQDHHFFHSLYVKDPDGNVVEITTLAVSEDVFYQQSSEQ